MCLLALDWGEMMEIRLYETLPAEAMAIRNAVFVQEQGFADEVDEVDARAGHLVAYAGATAIATCRFYRAEREDAYIVGRIAVLQPWRGRHVGAALLRQVEAIARARQMERVILHAQCRACAFYEKQGYTAFGEMELEQDCPHIWMGKAVAVQADASDRPE